MFVLSKAIPHIDESNNSVVAWELEGTFSSSVGKSQFQETYPFIFNCLIAGPNKPLASWTKSEIEALYPQRAFQNTFNNIKNMKDDTSKVTIDDSFDINSL